MQSALWMTSASWPGANSAMQSGVNHMTDQQFMDPHLDKSLQEHCNGLNFETTVTLIEIKLQ